MVEKATAKAVPKSYSAATEIGFKSVLSRNVNRTSPKRLRLKPLISTKHDRSCRVRSCVSKMIVIKKTANKNLICR